MIINYLLNLLSKFLYKESDYINIDIVIPKEIFFRTQLICNYISVEENCNFDLTTFIYLLYLDFVKNSIINYNPQKVFERLTHNYIDKKSLIITNGYENYELKNSISTYTYNICFDKFEASKGQLILDELYELFHTKIPFCRLLEALWISFIYEYKTGDNKKTFNYLRKILKENIT